jgi:hypothetical protein
MKHRIISEHKIKLQKVIQTSQTITTETSFSGNQSDRLIFHGSVLIRDKNWAPLLDKLSLVTIEGGLYRRPLISPSISLRRKTTDIPLKRRESKDCA